MPQLIKFKILHYFGISQIALKLWQKQRKKYILKIFPTANADEWGSFLLCSPNLRKKYISKKIGSVSFFNPFTIFFSRGRDFSKHFTRGRQNKIEIGSNIAWVKLDDIPYD